MKRKIFYSFLLLIGIIILANINSYASSSATYFDGKAPKISNTDNIDILSNDVKIDTTTSTINNTLILKNTSNSKVTTTIDFPLENKELSTSIHDLSINVNNLNITKYVTVDSGNYAFKIEIPANESKKIILDYKTDNDLQNAKVIKYSLDNLYGKTVKKLNVNIIINEKDIPLVKAIYPNAYAFDNNTISINYYNFKVNNLTKDVIIEKETYKNLLYGQDVELSENDKVVLKNIDEWFTNGVSIDYSKDLQKNNYAISNSNYIDATIVDVNKIYAKYFKKQKILDMNIFALSNISTNIMKYLISKQVVKDGRTQNLEYYYPDLGYDFIKNMDIGYNPLVDNYLKNNFDSSKLTLKGKNICIFYKQTEQGKELYVRKNISGSENMDLYKEEEVNENEGKILRTNVESMEPNMKTGANIIFVGQTIDGSDIDATDEEIVKYVDMINADMFIVVELYDGNVNRNIQTAIAATENEAYPDLIIGYYNENNYDMAKTFITNAKPLTESEFNNTKYSYIKNYNTYQNYLNEISKYYKDKLKLINTNNEMANSEIPTFIQFIGFVTQKNNKNVVDYFYDGYFDSMKTGLGTTKNTIETSQAKKLLEDNKNKNETTKNEVDSEIASIKITNDSEDFYKTAEPVNIDEVEDNSLWQDKLTNFINKNKDIIVLSAIALSILICIIILIKKNKHNKKSKDLNKDIK